MAEALSQHEGDLYLFGVTAISDEAAKHLAKYDGGSLWLLNLIKISEEAAAALRANPKIVLSDKFKR